MAELPGIISLRKEMETWRRELHATPETAFREYKTAGYVAARLREFGLDVRDGVGGTGVIASLSAGQSARAIALRAELDAVSASGHRAASRPNSGSTISHACGHDGHMAMLLAAAKHLAATRNFDGTVRFIFQPAEEVGLGAARMLAENLLDESPFDAVFALHGVPGLAVGEFAIAVGPVFAAANVVQIVLRGHPGHDALPHQIQNPIVAAATLVQQFNELVANRVSPYEVVALSVTGLVSADDWNSVPEQATLTIVVRSLSRKVQDRLLSMVSETAERVAVLHGCAVDLSRPVSYLPTINDSTEARNAAMAAEAVVDPEHVHRNLPPAMNAEDFGNLASARPGCYVMLGTGHRGRPNSTLHDAGFDFNDDALALGASFWVALVETRLPQLTKAPQTSVAGAVVSP